MVANFGAVLGRRITLGPGIRTDDGLLDVCVFSPQSLRDAIRIMGRLLRADFAPDPCMLYVRGRDVFGRDDSDGALAGGRRVDGHTPFHVVVEPLAARLLVPREGTPA